MSSASPQAASPSDAPPGTSKTTVEPSSSRVRQAPCTSPASPAPMASTAQVAMVRSPLPLTPSTRRRTSLAAAVASSRVSSADLAVMRSAAAADVCHVRRSSAASGSSGVSVLMRRMTPTMGSTARPSMASHSRIRTRRAPSRKRRRERPGADVLGVGIGPARGWSTYPTPSPTGAEWPESHTPAQDRRTGRGRLSPAGPPP